MTAVLMLVMGLQQLIRTAIRHASDDPLLSATAPSCLPLFYKSVVFPAPSPQSTITVGLCAVSLSVCLSVGLQVPLAVSSLSSVREPRLHELHHY